MIVNEIRRAFHAEPFQPFVLHLTDGRSLFVYDNFHIAIEPEGRSVAVALPDGSIDFLEPRQIKRLDIASTARS